MTLQAAAALHAVQMVQSASASVAGAHPHHKAVCRIAGHRIGSAGCVSALQVVFAQVCSRWFWLPSGLIYLRQHRVLVRDVHEQRLCLRHRAGFDLTAANWAAQTIGCAGI